MRTGRAAAYVAVALLLAGCTGGDGQPPAATAASSQPAPRPSPTEPSGDPSREPPGATETPTTPARFRPGAAIVTVRHLAGAVGPRLATSAAYDRAAGWVERRFTGYGYDVSRQGIHVPAGDSWGVPVDAGSSANVIATPSNLDPTRPWRLVGAHLDTVAVAPGAEDNASGVAVLLELARLAAEHGTAIPTVFVAFGAEEPVGAGEALHHFGSRLHAARLPSAQRDALAAMVSLDRVGVGAVVPVCTGGISPLRVRDGLIELAGGLGIATSACTDNTTSDHWSYEQREVTVARIGSTPYASYHSAADVPAVVTPDQLDRVGRLMWAWLQP